MNKLVNGSIAGAVGIALLLGGAGSLALWNDSASVSGADLTTGELRIVSNGDGGWDDDVDLLVPGDTVTYVETFDITAAGDNIAAQVEASYDADATTDGITTTTTVTIAGLTASNGIYTLAAGDYVATATVVVSFDATDTDNQNVTASLGDVEVTVSQVPAP